MNILFAIIPEKGHINPYIGPAQALADRGHTVAIAAPADISEQVEAAGLPFVHDLINPEPGERPTHGAELVELIQDAPRLAKWIEQLLLSDIPPQVEQLRRCIRRLNAQVVVIDPLYYPAAIAAHAENIPWASVSNSLNPVLPPHLDSELIRTTRALAPRRAAIFSEYGLHPRFVSADVLSPFLNIAFTTEALCGPVPGVELAGPSLPVHKRGDEVCGPSFSTNRPLVYASFGSQIYHWPEIFARLQAAAQRADFQLILSAGDLADKIIPNASTLVYRYAPQPAMLKLARVFITHGGANSFMEAISAGVPMLLSPMCNDQFHQAYFLQKSNIGIVADLRRMPIAEIAAGVQELMRVSSPHRAAMSELSKTYQGNGALRTAELIERLRI